MKEKDCGLEIKEVEKTFDMCLDVSLSRSISIFFLVFSLASFGTPLSTRNGWRQSILDSLLFISWDQSGRIEENFLKCTLRSIYFRRPHCRV